MLELTTTQAPAVPLAQVAQAQLEPEALNQIHLLRWVEWVVLGGWTQQ